MWPNPPALVSLWPETPAGRIHTRTNRLPQAGAPAVVLVHGAVVSGSYLLPTAARLASRARVYVPDLPGYGASDKPWPPLGLAALAEALADWQRELSLPRAHYVGNSFGCQVLVELAVRHPDLIDKLVLVGPTVEPGARSVPAYGYRFLRALRWERRGLLRLLRSDYAAAGLRRAIFTHRVALLDRIEEKLPRVTAPTLVVRGEHDPLVSAAWAREAARVLPRGEFTELPGTGHAVNYSAPAALARELRRFLDLA